MKVIEIFIFLHPERVKVHFLSCMSKFYKLKIVLLIRRLCCDFVGVTQTCVAHDETCWKCFATLSMAPRWPAAQPSQIHSCDWPCSTTKFCKKDSKKKILSEYEGVGNMLHQHVRVAVTVDSSWAFNAVSACQQHAVKWPEARTGKLQLSPVVRSWEQLTRCY